MALDDVPRDRHTQTETVIRVAPVHIALAEPVEHVRQELAPDADALIAHHDLRHGIVASQLDVDNAFARRKFHGVRHEVDYYLLETFRVHHDQRQAAIELLRDTYVLFVCLRSHRIERRGAH